MQPLPRNINPFALMLDPQAVIAQIERSERLEGLHRRVCRPLDKPLLGVAQEADTEAVSAEATIDEGTDEGADDADSAAARDASDASDASSGAQPD